MLRYAPFRLTILSRLPKSLTTRWEHQSQARPREEDPAFFTETLRIPAKPITDSDLMAITIPSDAERRRSEATLSCSYHAEVIGIRQPFCC